MKNVSSLPRDLQETLLAMTRREPNRWRIFSSSRTPFEAALQLDQCSAEFLCELTTCSIRIPPLHERRSEIPLLAQQVLETRHLTKQSRLEGFASDVLREFENYYWPGNLRELVAVVEEACSNCIGSHVELQDLPFRFRAGLDAQRTGPPLKVSMQGLDDFLLDVERDRITEVLELVQGNKSAAAEILGIPRPKLYRRLEALGLVDVDSVIQPDEGSANNPDSSLPQHG